MEGAECLSLSHNMQSGSEAHPAFSVVGTVCSLAGSKAAGPFSVVGTVCSLAGTKAAGPFIYSPCFQFCPYRAVFGKNNQYYWKLLVYRKC
jgi:hypothetical protein